MRALLAAVALLMGCPTAAPPASDPTPAPPGSLPSDTPGPYPVSATTLEGVDDRGKWIVTEVWYPAAPEDGAEFEPYSGLNLGEDAYRDAPWDLRGGPYPVVAFSHGYGGIRFQSSYLTTWLASHGFVVVAPDHNNNTLLDLDGTLTTRVAAERPRDVAVAVDRVVESFPDAVSIANGYAMVGHSFGGWTTLVVGGGVIDRAELLEHCAANDLPGCRFFEGEDLEGLADLGQAVPDSRVSVAVALAPGLAYSFGADGSGLAANVPTLVQGGSRDSDMPYDREIRPVFEALPDTARFATLQDAAHFGFSDLCTTIPIGGECEGAAQGYMEIERVHAVSRTLTTAWIRARWRGEESEERFLDAATVEAEGDVTWE